VAKKGFGPLSRYNGSLPEALKDCFPELQFEFKEYKPPGYWQDVNTCRKYFDSLAEQHGFDPLDAKNWYSVYPFSKDHALNAYPGGVKAALQRAYPQLSFTKWKDTLELQERWADPKYCRIVFDWYASTQGFDPLDPQAWYSVTSAQLLAVKGGRSIRAQYGGFRNALQQAYPEVAFAKWLKRPAVLIKY